MAYFYNLEASRQTEMDDYINKFEKLMGKEKEKLLKACTKLYKAKLYYRKGTGLEALKRPIYGIAKRHHVNIEWCGCGICCCPDRFLVYYKGKRLGMIQC